MTMPKVVYSYFFWYGIMIVWSQWRSVAKISRWLKIIQRRTLYLYNGYLLLYKLRNQVKDLDLCVSVKLFEPIIADIDIDLSFKNDYGFYCLNDLAEVVVNNKQECNRNFNGTLSYRIIK